jgi:2,4-dienoyl-CoA reductase-like NADH-dependent reductase (Old Yellow Enzyme family)
MYSSDDGFAIDFHLVHLGSRASGGFSLVFQEATAVNPEGRITYRDLGIWKDAHKDKLKQVVDFCHTQDALIGIQLAHAGRKASHLPPYEGRKEVRPEKKNGWQTVSSSALPFQKGETPPAALDEKGIQKVNDDFVAAAKRAKEIGYDVIEIHAAHGYLLHQFYSPLSNQRSDQYGGSFENRVRLLLEVTESVKSELGEEKPLFVRISATDWTEGGWTIEDSVKLAKHLKDLGVDLIDTSTGGNVS